MTRALPRPVVGDPLSRVLVCDAPVLQRVQMRDALPRPVVGDVLSHVEMNARRRRLAFPLQNSSWIQSRTLPVTRVKKYGLVWRSGATRRSRQP